MWSIGRRGRVEANFVRSSRHERKARDKRINMHASNNKALTLY